MAVATKIMFCCGNITDTCLQSAISDGTAHSNLTPSYLEEEPEDHVYSMFFLLAFGYCLSFLVIIGCVTNVCSIFLFSKQCLWSYANYYVIAVAAWDISLLIFSWLAFSLPTLVFQGEITYSGHKLIYLYPYTYTLCNISMVGCVWITLALSIDRCCAIKNPLAHRGYASKKLACSIIACVSLLATLYCLPRYFELAVVDCFVDSNRTVLPMIDFYAGLNVNPSYFTGYRVVGGLLTCSAGPCLTLFCLTALMHQALKRAKYNRDEMKTIKKRRRTRIEQDPGSDENKMTLSLTTKPKHSVKNEKSADRMLFLVLTKFLACYTLPTMIDVLKEVMPGDSFEQQSIAYLVDISDLLVTLHSSTNFFIYIICGSRVRKVFMRIVRRQLNREHLSDKDVSARLNMSDMYQTTRSRNSDERFNRVIKLG